MFKNLYYGWFIVAASLFLVFLDGLLIYSFGIFMPSINEAYDLSLTMGSSLFSFRCFIFAFAMLLSGRLIDIYNPKIVVFCGGLIAALGLYLTAYTNELWQLYITYGFMAGFGNGFLYITCVAVISRWFIKRRALAIGIATTGVPISGMIVNPICAWLISTVGLKDAFIFLSLFFFVSLFNAFVLRRNPDETEFDSSDEGNNNSKLKTESVNWTAREAFKSSTFWLMYLIFWLGFNTFLIVVINLYNYTIESGIDPLVASGGPAAIGLGSIIGRLFFSGVVPKFLNYTRIVFLCFMLEASSILIILITQETWSFYIFGFLFGFTYSGHQPIFPTLLGNFYGTKAVGTIYGLFGSGFSLAAITGPIIAGIFYDNTGNYFSSFVIATVVCFLAGFFSLFIRKPEKKPTPV